jgi:threonyl-tRNA synthetase
MIIIQENKLAAYFHVGENGNLMLLGILPEDAPAPTVPEAEADAERFDATEIMTAGGFTRFQRGGKALGFTCPDVPKYVSHIAIDTEMGKDYVINEGDGAFYGPKLDFHLADSLGRTWQCGTIQLDMQLPERFELEYVGEDGAKHRPVMIHRVVLGSIERFIGVITEHFAGAFPVWLAPVQVKVMPITDRTADYAKAVADKLNELGFRAETDLRNEKIGYKIREAQMNKLPYMLVIGDREAEAGAVAVRTRTGEDLGAMPVDEFIAKLSEEVKTKAK